MKNTDLPLLRFVGLSMFNLLTPQPSCLIVY